MNSRRKGHNWERDLATRLREIFGAERVRRGRQAEGACEPDVVVEDVPWWFECKCGGPAEFPAKALVQAEDDSARRIRPSWPVAICKMDRKPPTASLRLDTLFRVVQMSGVSLGRALVTLPLGDFLRVVEAVELRQSEARGKKHAAEWPTVPKNDVCAGA